MTHRTLYQTRFTKNHSSVSSLSVQPSYLINSFPQWSYARAGHHNLSWRSPADPKTGKKQWKTINDSTTLPSTATWVCGCFCFVFLSCGSASFWSVYDCCCVSRCCCCFCCCYGWRCSVTFSISQHKFSSLFLSVGEPWALGQFERSSMWESRRGKTRGFAVD